MFRDELVSKLEEVALGMRKARTRVFTDHGYGAGQARVLSALFEYGELSQADIGRIVDIAGPTVTKLVESLTEKGFISVRDSSSDKRIKIVSLSRKGKLQETLIQDCIDEICGIATEGFSEPEIIMTGMLLARISENLKIADEKSKKA